MRLFVYIVSIVLLIQNVYPLNYDHNLNGIIKQDTDINDVIRESDKIFNYIQKNDFKSLLLSSPDDILISIEKILDNIDPKIINKIADGIKNNLPIEITNQQLENLISLLNNGNISFTENQIVDIFNLILNTNETNFNQIINYLIDKYPSIDTFINDESTQNIINKIIQDPNSIDINDVIGLVTAAFKYVNLTDSQRKHLEKYLPELIIQLALANDPSDYFKILEPIVLYHVEYYLNGTTLMQNIYSIFEFISQNPIIQKILSTNNLTFQDLLKLFEPLLSQYIPDKSIRAHLFTYMPQLIDQLSKANSSKDFYNIIQSIFYTHLEFYLKNSNITTSPMWLTDLLKLDSIKYILNSNYDDLLFTDFLNVLIEYYGLPELNKLQKDHFNIYLPELIFKLLKAQNIFEVWSILDPVITSHLKMIISDPNIIGQIDVLNYESVQLLLLKLSMDPSSILPSDIVNIYIEYMKWPELTQSQINHLNIYIPNLLIKVLSGNNTDWYSILEPLISYHLNYYLYINPDLLNNLIKKFLENSTLINDLLNLINPFKYFNLTDTQLKHLFEYIPNFVFNLTQINNLDELAQMIKPIIFNHIYLFVSEVNPDDLSKYVAKVDMRYEDLMIALFNKSAGPLLNTSEFMSIIEDFTLRLMISGNANTSDLFEKLLAYLTKKISVPLRFIIQSLSPGIYEFAKDKTDLRVLLAYMVHAGEDLLHKNLIVWGIPYDTVYLGEVKTSQAVPCITTTRKGIDQSILDILEELNKQLNDLSKFLGDLSENDNLKPFDLDIGGFDY